MTARSCVFQIYQPNFSGWKASSSLISDCFFLCFFLISIREKSDQRLFFSVFWMQQSYHFSLFSQTSPYLYWRRSTPPKFKGYIAWSLHIIGTSSAFVKKKRIGLCFTDGNMWPSKNSNAPPPPKYQKGAKHTCSPQNN